MAARGVRLQVWVWRCAAFGCRYGYGGARRSLPVLVSRRCVQSCSYACESVVYEAALGLRVAYLRRVAGSEQVGDQSVNVGGEFS